ncbi:fimbrial chaperone protein [Paraburkholderia caballeronis]|uniref:Fimbrial chaperone protein n=2 Tax=Paraburkholderia caballeronis TaxID=416943 RepID=A0A1H7FVV7_9BURK|nr:fimbrial chaperone protein [Paraburkholderia caballeronis]PXX00571.1 fimbrial chaperone protein [Paraburkholderia caballeronis]TDV35744.1 fimbrial chaperone protein [Paraburkholderia caballeronis]SEE68692.1 fimbrial chaperone protein [Paraburkholderia caballeronis]SEK29397.1 fimbrial chaperone protein [Paraburkholderia caballeronis]
MTGSAGGAALVAARGGVKNDKGYVVVSMKSAKRAALALLVAFATCGVAQAASSVLIAPVDPKLAAESRSVALWLENRGDASVSLQIRVFGWEQRNFADDYPEQDQVVASPPVATIAPGKKQLVRLIRTQPVPPGTELPLRVLVDDIPVAHDGHDDAPAGPTTGIRFQMRYSVPLFVYGSGLWIRDPVLKDGSGEPAVPSLVATVVQHGGRRFLNLRNDGPVHARLAAVQMIDGGGHARDVAKGLLGYVLPGAAMRWPLPDDLAVDAASRLRAKVNDEPQPWLLPIRP